MKAIFLISVFLLSLNTYAQDSIVWSQYNPANQPSARGYHAISYNSVTGNTLLFGGADGTYLNDTWEWDGTNWTLLSPTTSPGVRIEHTMVFDENRGVHVLYGGYDNHGQYYGGVWEYNGSNWVWKSGGSVSPGSEEHHAMTYNPVDRRVYLYGGYHGTGGHYFGTYAWDGNSWINATRGSSPAPRAGHAMAFHKGIGKIVLFGGGIINSSRNCAPMTSFASTWEYDMTTGWRGIPILQGPLPPKRCHHGMYYDEDRDRIVIFGGKDHNHNLLNDVWEYYYYYDPVSRTMKPKWEQRTPANAPHIRQGNNFVVYDKQRREALIFGGSGWGQYHADTQALKVVNPASFTSFGSGSQGSGGVPELYMKANEQPWIGEDVTVRVRNLPVNRGTYFVYGFSNTSFAGLPLPLSLVPFGAFPGSNLFVSGDIMLPGAIVTSTEQSSTIPIPNDPSLVNMELYVQVLSLDNGGYSVSNGGTMKLGQK